MSTREELRRALDVVVGEGDVEVKKDMAAARSRAAERARKWLNDPNIQGLGVASRERGDERSSGLALKIYVAKKLPRGDCENPVPATLVIPGVDTRVRTDVEEIGEIRPQSNTAKVRPVIGGFSAGHSTVPFGTLGCLVRKIDDPSNLYILSNAHVLADYGLAPKGDPIIQPGRDDKMEGDDCTVAILEECIPFIFTATGFPNRADAAIARVLPGIGVDKRIRLIGVPLGVSQFLREGMLVQKTGRTSDFTTGIIKDIDFRLPLSYKRTKTMRGRVGFGNQVLCTRFTADGDSGAAVLNSNRKIVGLHFAGSASASVFSRIGFVTSALGIEIVL